MERLEARLVQYQVLAGHRLHFGRLYFQVIGVNLALVVTASTAIAIGRPDWWTATRLLAGLLLIGTAFVAYRVQRQEEGYATALHLIEGEEEGMVQLPSSPRPGARQVVVMALAATGLLLAMEAGVSLI